MFYNVYLIVIVNVIFVYGNNKFNHFIGGHSFPKHNYLGYETANEFELVIPNNIQKGFLGVDSYSITLVTPLVINNDDIVTVYYESSNPINTDWIGAYSPANVDILNTVPVKYGYCDDSKAGVYDYLSTGSGYLTFNLTNLRADVIFYYFKNGTQYPIVVGKSENNVTFVNINQPLRPRIVATGDINVLSLLWSSANSITPIMKWGLTADNYKEIVNATTKTIKRDDLCGGVAVGIGWHDLGLIHTANFTGISKYSGKKIYYIYGDESTNNFSNLTVLFVPPNPGIVAEASSKSMVRPTKAILFDDLGRGSSDMTYTWNEYGKPSLYTMQALGHEVLLGNVDVIYHGGDISYADGYIAVWDFFFDMISPVAGSVVYLSTVGNHESDWYDSDSLYSNNDSGGECGVIATALLPQPKPSLTNKPWWSYEVGMFHFIGISTEHDYSIGSEQYLWFENDLKSINRSITPWVIFGGHRAMYLNSNYSGTASSDKVVMDLMIKNLEPLLYQYKVDLGFYGHNHVVQRHAAVFNKTVIQHATEVTDKYGRTIYYHHNPQATVHMVVGTGGAGFTKNAEEPYPDWNELVFYQWGYARLTAVSSTHLDWVWVNSETGEEVDRMVITKDSIINTDDNDDDNSNDGLSEVAIVGIVIGVVGFFGCLVIVCYFFYTYYYQTSILTTTSTTTTTNNNNTIIETSSSTIAGKNPLHIDV